MTRRISRRRLLIGVTSTSAGLAGCSFFSTNSSDNTTPTGQRGAKEAPALAEQVRKGALPALEKRLPTNPKVVEPWESNGLYGGTVRRVLTSQSDATGGVSYVCRAGLSEFDLRTYEPTSGLAEWRVSSGGRRYTFTLRKGLKWSDGHDYTTDDVAFYFQDVLGDSTLSPAPPNWFVIDGEAGTFTKVDATTFHLDFAAPHALLPRFLALAAVGDPPVAAFPKHYLAQFHPAYTPMAEVQKAATGAGFDTWDQYFTERSSTWTNPDVPVMGAWKVSQPATGSASHAVLERNPYYWKVDTAGHQLPYVDRITYDFMDVKVVPIRAAGGEVDLQYRYISYASYPVLAKSADQNNFRIYQWVTDQPWIALFTNQSHRDPAMRRLIQNRDFRAGLSHAINRDEMNEAIYTGLGITTHPGPIKQDPCYIPGYGKTFTDYDVDRAIDLLDSVGLDQRDGDGWRLRPDGKRLELQIMTFDFETGAASADAYEMVTRYWADVQVKATYKVVTTELWSDRAGNNDFDIAGYTCTGFHWDIDPVWWVPTQNPGAYWGPLFGEWYQTGGKQGEQPPPDIHRLQQLYDQMKITMDEKKRIELGREIIRAHDENVWIIGTVGTPFQPFVVNEDLLNVRSDGIESWTLGHEQATWYEQVAYRNPQEH